MSQNNRLARFMKIHLAVILLMAGTLCAQGQRNTYSPYSRYGYGILHEPNFGGSGAMGSVSAGMRSSSEINPFNPASFSAVDSTTFLFDFAITGTYSNYKENGESGKVGNFYLDHVALKFPLMKNWGLSAGLYEYSQVGYLFGSTTNVKGMAGEDDTYAINAYTSTGGINDLYVGTAYRFFRHLSVGFNWHYKFGTIQYLDVLTYPERSAYATTYVYDFLKLRQSNFEFGLQWEQKIGKKHQIVLGGTYTLPAPFKWEAYSMEIVQDTTFTYYNLEESPFTTPHCFSAGLSYTYDNRLTFAADYRQQNWSDAKYFGKTDTLSDARRVSFGVEYLPRFLGENYFQVIKYRGGLHFSESYIKFAGQSLKEIGVSLGVGLPVRGIRSVINVMFEANHTITDNPDQIQEFNMKLAVGITFNENWFVKRRFN